MAGSRDFTAVTQYINTGAWNLTHATKMSMAVWVYFDSISNTVDVRLISKAGGTATDDHDWMLGYAAVGSGGQYQFRVRVNGGGAGAGWTILDSNVRTTTGTWMHVATAIDIGAGVQNVKIWVNGTQVVNTAPPESGSFHNSSSNNVIIGNNRTVDSNAPDGKLAGAAVWDGYLLTQSDVDTLQTSPPSSVQSANLIMYLPMRDGDSPEPDEGTGNHDGTVSGASFSALFPSPAMDDPSGPPNNIRRSYLNFLFGTMLPAPDGTIT